MNRKKKELFLYLIITIILIVIDQATKLYIKGFNFFGIEHQGMQLGSSKPLLGDFIRITFVENAGMAFGIEFGTWKIFLSFFSLIAALVLIYYLYKILNSTLLVKIGITLIIAGALGNWVDRMFYGVFYGESPLFYGHVVDFIQVDIPDINIFGNIWTHWPVFNFADSYVTIGMIILLLFHSKLPELKEIF